MMMIIGIRFNKIFLPQTCRVVQLSTIQHHGIFSTSESNLNMFEGFFKVDKKSPYLPLRPDLDVAICHESLIRVDAI